MSIIVMKYIVPSSFKLAMPIAYNQHVNVTISGLLMSQ